jgi:hypothetical protein
MRRTLHIWLRRLTAAAVRVISRVFGRTSPWDRVKLRVPVSAFGLGSRRQFAHYFEGESRVRAESIDGIVEWLLQCEYASDPDLFNERDFWQHPTTFEDLRRGDCEDFALWAWRKLGEIGIAAEFYVGRVIWSDEAGVDRQHAWVVCDIEGTPFLFEPAARTREHMMRPLADVMDQYVPHFAVNHRFRTSAFCGCVLDARRHYGARERASPTDSRLESSALQKR